jgi:hypothetical protein
VVRLCVLHHLQVLLQHEHTGRGGQVPHLKGWGEEKGGEEAGGEEAGGEEKGVVGVFAPSPCPTPPVHPDSRRRGRIRTRRCTTREGWGGVGGGGEGAHPTCKYSISNVASRMARRIMLFWLSQMMREPRTSSTSPKGKWNVAAEE